MQESAKLFYAGASPVRNSIYGDCSQAVKTMGCDPIMRGFESHQSPQILWPTGLHGVVARLSRGKFRGDRYPCRSPY